MGCDRNSSRGLHNGTWPMNDPAKIDAAFEAEIVASAQERLAIPVIAETLVRVENEVVFLIWSQLILVLVIAGAWLYGGHHG